MQKWKQSQEKTNHIELLAPAGSYETFCGVINAGADAVYAGGQKFGARAYANNFTDEELIRAIELSHALGKRFYLTLNTLLRENETQEMLEYIQPLYEAGLDAVIIQDIGIARLLKQVCPDMELHASTQMTISSAYGVNFLEENGYAQAVLSRELSLDEIRSIREKTNIKLECFVHGALCYSYSGQCLMSSILGGRSGNRGRCAQPCRLSYDVKDKNGSLLAKQTPILSLKDMNGISSIRELAQIGVTSLKIEGRMKQLEYATGVTAMYRQMLDADDPKDRPDPSSLLRFGNRNGFTNGYLSGKNQDMVTKGSSSHVKVDSPDAQEAQSRYGFEPKLEAQFHFTLKRGQEAVLTMRAGGPEVRVTGPIPQEAQAKAVTTEQVRQKLSKLGNTFFALQDLTIDLDDHLFYSMSVINQLRRDAVEAMNAKLGERRIMQEAKLPQLTDTDLKQQAPSLSVLLKTKEQLQVILESASVDNVILDSAAFQIGNRLSQLVDQIKAHHKKAYYAMPVIFREGKTEPYISGAELLRKAAFDGFLVRSFDEIGYLKDIGLDHADLIADANLYVWNLNSVNQIKAWNMKWTLPLELNRRQLQQITDHTAEMIIYGKYPLMTSAQCILKNSGGCQKNKTGYASLTDRYRKEFPVETNCTSCENKIYNCVPTVLFSQSKEIQSITSRYRIELLDESESETKNVLELYEAFLKKKKADFPGEFTYGHFKRGVE